MNNSDDFHLAGPARPLSSPAPSRSKARASIHHPNGDGPYPAWLQGFVEEIAAGFVAAGQFAGLVLKDEAFAWARGMSLRYGRECFQPLLDGGTHEGAYPLPLVEGVELSPHRKIVALVAIHDAVRLGADPIYAGPDLGRCPVDPASPVPVRWEGLRQEVRSLKEPQLPVLRRMLASVVVALKGAMQQEDRGGRDLTDEEARRHLWGSQLGTPCETTRITPPVGAVSTDRTPPTTNPSGPAGDGAERRASSARTNEGSRDRWRV